MNEVAAFLTANDNYILTGHKDPDGDCVGSVIALSYILRKMGKKVISVFEDRPFFDPESLGFDLPIYYADDLPALEGNDYNLILLDAHNWYRMGDLEEILKPHVKQMYCIDHHPGEEPEGDFNYMDTSAAAIGEIIYELIGALHMSDQIDEKIAQAIYLSIYSDTGGFKFSNTRKQTHQIVADLFDFGVNPYAMYNAMNENKTYSEIRLLGKTLENLRLIEDEKIAYMVVSKDILKETRTTLEDIRNFTYYPRAIGSVKIAVLFTEGPESIDVAFRAKGHVKVNKIATMFGGGGHPNASGAELYGKTLDEVIGEVLAACVEELNLAEASYV